MIAIISDAPDLLAGRERKDLVLVGEIEMLVAWVVGVGLNRDRVCVQ